jgi:endoglucanase
VRWSNHAEPRRPYRIDEGFFQRVDFAIAEALRHDLNIVVNMRHYRQLDGDPLQEGEMAVEDSVLEERLVAMWAQIAQRYRSHAADKLFFELYNEPPMAASSRRPGTRSFERLCRRCARRTPSASW